MCTYVTRTAPVTGSGLAGPGSDEWLTFDRAVVYFDHPQHVAQEHALCVDLRAPSGERLAFELDAVSARALAESILATLDDDEVRPLLG